MVRYSGSPAMHCTWCIGFWGWGTSLRLRCLGVLKAFLRRPDKAFQYSLFVPKFDNSARSCREIYSEPINQRLTFFSFLRFSSVIIDMVTLGRKWRTLARRRFRFPVGVQPSARLYDVAFAKERTYFPYRGDRTSRFIRYRSTCSWRTGSWNGHAGDHTVWDCLSMARCVKLSKKNQFSPV